LFQVVQGESSDAAGAGVSPRVANAPKKPPVVPPRNRGGRPKGSKNKYGRDARLLLQEKGDKVIDAMINIALGRKVRFRDKDAKTGQRREVVPTVAEMLVAQGHLVKRIAPELSSSEVAAKVTSTVTDSDADVRFIAMTMLHVLREAKENGVDVDLSGVLAGDTKLDMTDVRQAVDRALTADAGGAEPEPPPDKVQQHANLHLDRAGAGAPPESPPEPEPGDRFDVADANDAQVWFAERLIDGRERWVILRCDGLRMETKFSREAAEARARELAEKGKI